MAKKYTYRVCDSLSYLQRTKNFSSSLSGDAVVCLDFPREYVLVNPLFIKFSEEIDPRVQNIIFCKTAIIEPLYCVKINNATLQDHSIVINEDKCFFKDLAGNSARKRSYPGIYQDQNGKEAIDLEINFEKANSNFVEAPSGLLFFHAASGYGHGHFILQTLVKLSSFEKAGIQLKKLVVQPSIRKYQREILNILGYPEADLVVRNCKNTMMFRELYVTYTSNRVIPDLTVYDKLLELIPENKNYPEKIYVSRGDKSFIRRFLNEDKIIDVAKEYGFEVIIPSQLTLEEEINIFRRAKVVISPVGGGLYNTVFSKPGTTIIALSDPCYVIGWPMQLASLRQHQLGFIFGNSFWSYTEGVYFGTHNNFIIDPELLREAIESVL